MMQAAPPAIVRELEAIEEQLAATYKNHDCDGWGALLGDEWTVTHIGGQVIARADAIAACRTAPTVTQTFDQMSVRSYGDMAILTARNTVRAATDPPQTIVLRFTDVFVRRNGKWVAVASHATKVE